MWGFFNGVSVIVALAAYCEPICGCVAALAILPQSRPLFAAMRGRWVADYNVDGSGAMRCIRCLRVGGSLAVADTGVVIVPVSTD